MDVDPQARRDELVMAALPHVAFEGWTMAALAEGAGDLGWPPTIAGRVFPGGAIQALEHFVTLADRRLVEDFAARGPRVGRIDDKVFVALQMRLDRWSAHREAIRRAVAVLAMPLNLPLAARLNWATAASIWSAVGDRSEKGTRLTKQGSLAALYSATLFFWLDDRSEGATDTWAFLRRRLNDMKALPRLRRRIGDVARKALRPSRHPAAWERRRSL